MTDISTKAIPVVEPPVAGVHLMWLGPPRFLFAPGGWRIERRKSVGAVRIPSTCDSFTRAQIEASDELRLNLGVLTVSRGTWPGPEGGACEIWTIELDGPTSGIHGTITGPEAFLYGLRNGKAAAFAGPLGGNFDFGAAPIDTLVIYVRFLFTAAATLRLCRYRYEADDWSNAKLLANLQLPIRELMPSLANADAEFAEAKRRLLPGETLDVGRFGEVMNLLRGLAKSPPSAPIQKALLIRANLDDDFDEMCLIDPLRMVYSSPLWRRVLGFSFFDADPALVVNQAYDYRITGMFPADLETAIYGFHTIRSSTALPAEFYLQDCHIRLPAPTTVRYAPGIAQTGLTVNTQRGIQLAPRPHMPWVDALLDQHCAVIDLPSPTSKIQLDLESGHQLTIEGGVAWGSFSSPIHVPAGSHPVVSFPQPVMQLRLTGKGFLFAIRVLGTGPIGSSLAPISAVLSDVHLTNTPRPSPPVTVHAFNLQAAAHLTTQMPSRPPRRHPLGIDVRWQPALATGLTFWPTQAASPPPLDATAFQVERRVEPAGPWQKLIGGDNLVLGSRDQPPRDTSVRPGVDMMELFPESPGPRGGGSEFNYSDVFLAPDPQNPQGNNIAQPPPPGTMLRYQVRAVDMVGRPSANWTLTDPVRLEKHESPPLPSAADETPADALPGPSLTGVNASVLVRGAQNMTSDDLALLGTSDNIIVLRWGWHAKQRKLDPYATQFRIYLSSPLDEVAGTLVSAAPDPVRPGAFRAHLQLARAIPADAAKGLFLEVGYPFFIETHGGGTDIQATVRTTIAAPGGGFRSPTPGAIRLPLKYSARLTRPDGWKERLQPSPGQAFVPITAAEQYQVVIRDRLVLTEDHPRDVMWAGVSAADDQAYVLDSFTGVSPGGPLPGNESAVAAVLCQGKRMIRPDLQPSLPTGPVPRIITPEPVNGPVRFRLDLGPYLTAAGLPAGALIKPERLHAADLLASLDVNGDALFARPVNPRAGETSQPLSLSNPDDQAAVVGALSAGDFESVDDRFLVVLAQMHPWRERLFEAATNDPINATAFDEALPSSSARYVYRVRTASLAGQLSDDGAVAHAVVRVPSPISGPSPVPDARRQDDPRASLRFRIPNSTRLSHALVFRLVLNAQSANAGGVLLRVPNRPDLYPGSGVQLRLQNDIVLVPTVVALSMLERDAQGWSLPVEPEAPQTGPVRVWVCTLTNDGVPSPLSGPWSIGFTPAPPTAPVLSGAVTADGLRFDWTWPAGATAPATLERSADGNEWKRISPPLNEGQSSFNAAATSAPSQYRLNVRTPGGRGAISNVIVV